MMQIFEAFFRIIYPIPVFSFPHRATVIQRYQSGLADPALLSAMVGLTVLLAEVETETGVPGRRYIEAAQTLVLDQLDKPSVTKLQVLVLVIKYRMLTRQSEAAFMLLPVATRMAYVLRLNYENPARTALTRESCRRLMWSVFMLDGFMAGGLPDFRLCAPETIHIPLPCTEKNFELGIDEPTQPLLLEVASTQAEQLPANTGLVTLYIRLQWMRGRTLQFTKQAVAAQVHDTVKIRDSVASLECDLEAFATSLPVKFVFSSNNLRLRAFSSRLSPYVLVHVWWHQCHCDLFRMALPGLREALPRSVIEQFPADFVFQCWKQCFDHAASIIKIFAALQSLRIDPPFMDVDLVACAYQSARYLFYEFQNYAADRGVSAEGIKSQADVCLSVIQGKFSRRMLTVGSMAAVSLLTSSPRLARVRTNSRKSTRIWNTWSRKTFPIRIHQRIPIKLKVDNSDRD